MPPIDFTRRTALYRLFDASDVLLYVGVAFAPEARCNVHRSDKAWWPQVARRTVEWHDTRLLALAAEDRAIEIEHPVHNRVGADLPKRAHSPARRSGASLTRTVLIEDRTWKPFGMACDALGISRSDELRLHMNAVVEEFERKQRRIARETAGASAED